MVIAIAANSGAKNNKATLATIMSKIRFRSEFDGSASDAARA
jgi:hypothetical protein